VNNTVSESESVLSTIL